MQHMDTKIKNFHRRFERKFGKFVGLGSSGLQTVSSLLQEVGNLPTWVYFISKYCFVLVAPKGLFGLCSRTQKSYFADLELFLLS